MKKNFNFLLLCLLIAAILPLPGYSGAIPIISRVEPVLLNDKIQLTIFWNSQAPVVEINASAGKTLKTVNEGVKNTRTNTGDFTGSASFIIDSSYVVVQKKYNNEQFISKSVTQHGGTASKLEYIRSTEPIQEVVRLTVWLKDRYGNQSEKIERIINKNVENAENLQANQNKLSNSSDEKELAEALKEDRIGVIIGAFKEIFGEHLYDPDITIVSVKPLTRGITIVLNVATKTPLQTLDYSVHSSSANSVVKKGQLNFKPDNPSQNISFDINNLSAGKYELKIGAKNSDGQENNKSQDIEIK